MYPSSGCIATLQKSLGSFRGWDTARATRRVATLSDSSSAVIWVPSDGAPSVILKRGSLLSMRGRTLRRLKLAMTMAAVSPLFAKRVGVHLQLRLALEG